MDFEDAKENIQPLAAGRNASILQAALHTESQEELQQQRRIYEDAIQSYTGEDPLEPWFEYVYWIEQSYPSGGKESGLDEVLIKCLTKFEKDQRYHQDRRMIKLYIKYIDNHEKPQECYQKLYHQGIGTMVADLYICWAYYYDLMGDFRSADQIFRKGLDCKAQPLQELQEAHQHFGFTMSQRILYNDDLSKEKYQSSMQEKRSALISLKSHKKKVGSIRTGAAVKRFAPGTVQLNSAPVSQQQNSIRVFNDGENQPCSIPAAEFAADSSVVKTILDNTRNQENMKEAGPWNKAIAKKKKLFTSEPRSELGFEILEDQEDNLPIKRKPIDLKPFIYLDGFKSHNQPQESWIIPVTTENQSTKGSYPSYDKCLIYPKPNMEFSLEELGCYFWCKKQNIQNKFTNKYDLIWKNNIQSGMRMYPNFAKINVPAIDDKPSEETDFDPYECLTDGKGKLVIDVKLCYPSQSGEEFQFEEIILQRWKNGSRKFKYDCNETIAITQEMEETMCFPTDGVRRKSFFPSRNSIFPVQHTRIETAQLPVLCENEEELPGPSNQHKSILKKPLTAESQDVNKGITFHEENVPQFAFKAPSSPVVVLEQPQTQQQANNFQIFEDEENNYEANESCSTQVFNCFIKPHSISTPKAPGKSVKLTNPSERQQTHSNLPETDNASAKTGQSLQISNQNCPATLALSPEYDAGMTLRGKQLSTIMETSEHATGSTGSTKFSINTPDFEVDVHQSRLPLMANVCTLETVDENKSLAERDCSGEKLMISIRQHKDTTIGGATANPNEISRLEQPEDTVPTMPAVRVFEDKTETVPKILITKLRTFPDVIEEKGEKSVNVSVKSVNYGHNNEKKTISSSRNHQNFACGEDMSFFDKPSNLELSLSKKNINTPASPSPAAVLHNSIFTSSAFMKFQDSPEHSMLKLNNSPERIVRRLSDVKTNTDENGVKNRTLDSLFLPNMSAIGCEKQSKRKNAMENSFLPGFANETSLRLSPEKYKQPTKDSFLSGFPSVAIGEHKPQEDSFVAYLSKNRNNETKNKDKPKVNVHCDSDSLLASFRTNEGPFKPKDNSADDKENIEKSFLLTLSPDLYKNSMFKIPTAIEDRSLVQKNISFLPNLSTTGALSKFQIHEDTDKSGLSNKISLLGLEDHQVKPSHNTSSEKQNKFHANYSSPQLKSLSSIENANSKTKAELEFPLAKNSSGQSQFKTDCFFEDNIRTEAFAVNLSMIKNSTLLPNYDFHQSQIKNESINIVDNLSGPSMPSSSVPEDFIRPHASSSMPSGSAAHHQTHKVPSSAECIEIQTSDEEPDVFGKSIYHTKTPKTPQMARHAWTTEQEDDTSDENSNNFVHHVADLDQTQHVIDNICESKNVNPFNKELIDAFLSQVEIISFVKTLPTCKLVRKVPPLKRDSQIELNGRVFNVNKLIGEGTFGSVYSAKESHSGKMFALKQERPANLWEYYICLEIQSRLHSNEMMSGFMNVEYALIGNNASVLISKFSRYGSLITVCNKIKKETLKNVDEYVVMHMASQLLLIMDHLHASNIIHADVKPDNFVLMDKLVFGKKQPAIQLIDFGNSIDMNLFPPGQTFTYIHENESFKCVEMCEKRPWTYQLDLFGLAGVIHVLLFGKYMDLIKKPTGWTHRTHVPRYLNKTLWDVIFHSLLNINNCQTMPNLQHLRAQLEEELAENDKLVCQKIIEFNRALDL
ncbi:uncharacterized protein LOC129942590 [Eupeodes corollae]|uniref:uncharacterized protein LOC129942590 n=1 Tax=Eupeodes corollae TaxID=290404 RepID=UPI002490760A|nr:uncharacterized protein LOC129942590 [Eupeodes corollae]